MTEFIVVSWCAASINQATGGERLNAAAPGQESMEFKMSKRSIAKLAYTAAAGVSGTRDTFVYVVQEEGGGKTHNRVVIQIKN